MYQGGDSSSNRSNISFEDTHFQEVTSYIHKCSQLSERKDSEQPYDSHITETVEVGSFDPAVPLNSPGPIEDTHYVYFAPELHNCTDLPTRPFIERAHSEIMLETSNEYKPIGSSTGIQRMSIEHNPLENTADNLIGISHQSSSLPMLGLMPQRRLTLPAMGQMSNNTKQYTNRGCSTQLRTTSAKPSSIEDQRHASTSSIQYNSSPRISKEGTSGVRGGRAKKGLHELLTEEERRVNHIASEQKRRRNIRVGFERLVDIVPTLNHNHKSESVILEKSVEYIHHLLVTKQQLKQRVRQLQMSLGEMNDDFDDYESTDDELYYRK